MAQNDGQVNKDESASSNLDQPWQGLDVEQIHFYFYQKGVLIPMFDYFSF